MPKVKTNSSAKKRNMRLDGTVAKSHVDFVKRLLRLK